MDMSNTFTTENQSRDDCREVWLLGQPPLSFYLNFVDDMVIGGDALAPSAIVDEWRAANDYYGELETSEAGFADAVQIRDIDPALLPKVKKVEADPMYQRAFDTLPTRIAMVELDRMIVGHPYLSLHHTDRIKPRIGPKPTAEALFDFCLPLKRNDAPVEVRKLGSQRYLFSSPSSDFRFQEAVLLRPEQTESLNPIGPLGGVLALMVGYGSNFLSAIQSDNRLLLHNGHHRAYALRELGITHAPCIIQTVTRVDELQLVARKSVTDDPGFYFAAKRPPLLKDFFDPRIRKVLHVQRAANVIEVTFTVKEFKQTRDLSAGA